VSGKTGVAARTTGRLLATAGLPGNAQLGAALGLDTRLRPLLPLRQQPRGDRQPGLAPQLGERG
jgi:hypothetical protein